MKAHCPKCKASWRGQVRECPACGAGLVAKPVSDYHLNNANAVCGVIVGECPAGCILRAVRA